MDKMNYLANPLSLYQTSVIECPYKHQGIVQIGSSAFKGDECAFNNQLVTLTRSMPIAFLHIASKHIDTRDGKVF